MGKNLRQHAILSQVVLLLVYLNYQYNLGVQTYRRCSDLIHQAGLTLRGLFLIFQQLSRFHLFGGEHQLQLVVGN